MAKALPPISQGHHALQRTPREEVLRQINARLKLRQTQRK